MTPAIRRALVAAAAVVAVLVLGLVFRHSILAWFTGKSIDSANAPGAVTPGPSTAAPTLPFAYPPAAFDALRSALDAYERARKHLANDETRGLSDDARALAEALDATARSVPAERADLRQAATRASAAAKRLTGAVTAEDARRAFADVSRDVVVLIGTDERLSSGARVFECGMFEGNPRWIQRDAVADNPYMGRKMPTCGAPKPWRESAAPRGVGAPDEIDHYTCSMHPSVKQAGPGKCPICGMDLVPVTKAQQAEGVVLIDETRRQLIGVRTAPVVLAPMRDVFRAVARVAYDESSLTDVSLKVKGWVTKLHVTTTGQRVARGQPLFQLYSPEIYAAQQDLLVATRGAAGMPEGAGRLEGVSKAARQRLRLLGVDDATIDATENAGTPRENVTFPAPASGFVIEKNVVEGAAIEAGARLYRIAALDRVWIEADIYERDLPHVHVGQPASVTLDYVPGHTYEAKVSYVYPYLDDKARVGHARLELANKQHDLRPGMYARVELASDLGPRVQVPAGAVVYTGPRRLVFVDLGGGRFRPTEVRVGAEADGVYEVLSGLHPGDVVATSGVFLIAAEARISTAAKYWDSAPEDGGMVNETATPPAPAAAPTRLPAVLPRAAQTQAPAPAASSASAPPATEYTCPMHPEVRGPSPGTCPKCGMRLEPRSDAGR